MGRSIQQYDGQKHPIDSDYKFGDIKDDTGALDGTIANRKSNADIHQYFMKLMHLMRITPNGLPDNEYDGYQYIQAAMLAIGNHRRLVVKDGLAQSDLAAADYSTVVIVKKTAQNFHIVSMDLPTGTNKAPITIYNYSAFSVEVDDFAGTKNINGAPSPFFLTALTAIEFTYNGTTDWVVTKKYTLENLNFNN